MRFAVYSPLAGAAFDPDAVIFRGNPRQIMLLTEAARAAGVFDTATVMGSSRLRNGPPGGERTGRRRKCRLHR